MKGKVKCERSPVKGSRGTEEKGEGREAMITAHVIFEYITLSHHYSTMNTHQQFFMIKMAGNFKP